MIYDHKSSNTANVVILAKEGYIYNSMDNNYMIIKLIDGVRYEESRNTKATTYDPRQQFTRFHFDETEMKFNMEVFQMKRTDEELFKSHHAMLNLKQLKYYTDSNTLQLDSLRGTVFREIRQFMNFYSNYYRPTDTIRQVAAPAIQFPIESTFNDQNRSELLYQAHSQAGYILNTLEMKALEEKGFTDKNVRYDIEWQRKFTLAVSCLLLFAIGAPLGAIIRKGGLGLPVVMAIIFFLIYHVISTMSEKSAREGDLSVELGMWLAIIVLTPLAVFLTYKAARDSSLFDFEQYRNFLEKLREKVLKIVKRV